MVGTFQKHGWFDPLSLLLGQGGHLHCWLHPAVWMGNCPTPPCSWRGIGADLRMGAKPIVLLLITVRTNYYVSFLLFLTMNVLGDSPHEVIYTTKPSKLVPAAGSTGAHWNCSWGWLIPTNENLRVTQVWGGKWEAWSWLAQWDG